MAEQRADWIYTPDPDAAAIALTVRGKKVLFDIHEEYHKGHSAQRLPRPLRRGGQAIIKVVLRMITRRVDLATSVNAAILAAYGGRPGKSQVSFNTPPAWFSDVPPAKPGSRSTTTFFHGKALAGNGTGVVLEALAILRRRGRDARVMAFPSPGPTTGAPYDPAFAERAAALDLKGALDLRDGQPHRAMPRVMSEADVGLIAYDRALATGSLPNRFFEYLALGIPVVVPEYAPLMVGIAVPHGIGMTADFEDPQNLADTLDSMMADREALAAMGARARAVFKEEFAWLPIFASLRERMVSQ